jgi:hypothetical protein
MTLSHSVVSSLTIASLACDIVRSSPASLDPVLILVLSLGILGMLNPYTSFSMLLRASQGGFFQRLLNAHTSPYATVYFFWSSLLLTGMLNMPLQGRIQEDKSNQMTLTWILQHALQV